MLQKPISSHTQIGKHPFHFVAAPTVDFSPGTLCVFFCSSQDRKNNQQILSLVEQCQETAFSLKVTEGLSNSDFNRLRKDVYRTCLFSGSLKKYNTPEAIQLSHKDTIKI